MDVNRRGIQPRWMKNKSASSNIRIERVAEAEAKEKDAAAKVCSVLNPSCEACQ
jgi:ribonucleoside-diphosphate reductase alpha chain